MRARSLTPEHHRLREEVRAFAEAEIGPRVARWEKAKRVETLVPRLMAQKGWYGATVPDGYGGMNAGHLAKTIMIEEVSRVCGAMGAALQASQLGVAPLLHFGTDAQKEQWLPKVAAGQCLPTIAVTEHGSGSHVLGMEATAHRDGDDYILNGHKAYIGNSHIGSVHAVVVRTGPGSKGLTAFLVESDRPGLALEPYQPALGLHGFSFGDLTMSQCRIPAANRVGEEGDGLAVAYSSSIIYGRANLAAVALGIHQAIVDTTTAFVSERHRYGRPLSALSVISDTLGDMEARLMTARQTAYHAADQLDHAMPCDMELMNAKLVNTEFVLDSARDAMGIHAAAGLRRDRPLERYLRDSFHLQAPAGTSDIQRKRIAQTTLGEHPLQQWSERFAPPAAPPPSAAA